MRFGLIEWHSAIFSPRTETNGSMNNLYMIDGQPTCNFCNLQKINNLFWAYRRWPGCLIIVNRLRWGHRRRAFCSSPQRRHATQASLCKFSTPLYGLLLSIPYAGGTVTMLFLRWPMHRFFRSPPDLRIIFSATLCFEQGNFGSGISSR